MLDLDSLAEKRAQALSQDVEDWRGAVWAADFQELAQSMSDGEVEAVISLCPTVAHLRWLIKFLKARSSEEGLPPFTVLSRESQRAGVSPGEWIAKSMASAST